MYVDFVTLEQKKYISLPGLYLQFKIKCKAFIPSNVTNILNVISFLESSKDHTFTFYSWQKCSANDLTDLLCLNIKAINQRKVTYVIVGNLQPNTWRQEKYKMSWNKATELCKSLGGDLPHFMSRYNLDEFIAMLLKSEKIPMMEAIFIGLKYNKIKVGLFLKYILTRKYSSTRMHSRRMRTSLT